MNHKDDPHKQEADELVRIFLRELDACQTERQRIEKVMELVYGIIRSAKKKNEAGA